MVVNCVLTSAWLMAFPLCSAALNALREMHSECSAQNLFVGAIQSLSTIGWSKWQKNTHTQPLADSNMPPLNFMFFVYMHLIKCIHTYVCVCVCVCGWHRG